MVTARFTENTTGYYNVAVGSNAMYLNVERKF